MNAFIRALRTLRLTNAADAGFEHYYGQIVRHNHVGGPSAAEARRDFAVVRKALDRAFVA